MPYESIPNPMQVPLQVEGGQAAIFECKELKLYEGSIVTFGANSETNVIDVKSQADADDKIAALKCLYEYLINKAPNSDYELMLRANYKKEISLLNTLAAQSTKEISKPKSIDWSIVNEKLNANLRK